MTIVVPSLTTHEYHPPMKQIKIPGGGAESGESPWKAAKREFHDETGFKFKPNVPHTLVYQEQRGMHFKLAYLVHFSHHHGKKRLKPRREKDSILYMPMLVALDDAIDIVHKSPNNSFHPAALRKARETILGNPGRYLPELESHTALAL